MRKLVILTTCTLLTATSCKAPVQNSDTTADIIDAGSGKVYANGHRLPFAMDDNFVLIVDRLSPGSELTEYEGDSTEWAVSLELAAPDRSSAAKTVPLRITTPTAAVDQELLFSVNPQDAVKKRHIHILGEDLINSLPRVGDADGVYKLIVKIHEADRGIASSGDDHAATYEFPIHTLKLSTIQPLAQVGAAAQGFSARVAIARFKQQSQQHTTNTIANLIRN